MDRQVRPIPMLLPKIGVGGDLKRGLLYAKFFYFFFYAAVGCLVPYLNVYFAEKGLSGAQIGWLGSIAPLIALFANPLWAALADRRQAHRRIMALCAVVGGALSLLYLLFDSFWPLMAVTVALTFFRAPIGPLLDSSTVDLTRRVGGHYGRQRVWGTIGFVAVTIGLGNFVTLSDLSATFWVHGLLLTMVCALLALALPIGANANPISLAKGLHTLVRQPGYLSYLGAMAIFGLGMSSFGNFLGLRMLEIGGNQAWVAWAWAINGMTEAPMMFLGARWFGRFAYGHLLQVGFLAYGMMWAMMALANSPLLLTLCAAANGLCFGAVWTAAVNYAGEAAPPGLGATSQALANAAQAGIGWGMGAVLAGYLWDATGGTTVFAMAACAGLLAALLFWLGNRRLEGPTIAG
jgi:MFS transporter, PPP family, 3-phenylpropionic acid transporter